MESRIPSIVAAESVPETSTVTDDSHSTDSRPKGISQAMWEKFQTLQKKRQEVTKCSTERRVKRLQADVLEKVKAEFVSEEDVATLREHNVSLEVTQDNKHRKRKTEDTGASPEENASPQSKIPKEEPSSETEAQWQGVQQYLHVNDHIKGVDKGRHAPKSGLEKKIDEAVALGDLDTAEKLSDHLATREFGKEIADAIDAKAYAEKKKKEEEIVKAKKKKKLAWGFDHKERWEMKANM